MNSPDWLSHLSDDELLTATVTLRQQAPDSAVVRDRVARAASILHTLKRLPKEPSIVCVGPSTTGEPKVVPVGTGLVVGRHPNCALAVTESTAMSRQHFRLRLTEGLIVLEDMESRNGTFINDPETRLQRPRVLLDGDLILAGEMAFLFVNAGDD